MSLKRQTLWIMMPLLVVSVVNIFSVPLFYKFLGTEMYALWFYVLTFSGMFGFADMGLGAAVGRYMGVAMGRGDEVAAREYWGTGNLIALPLLAVTGLLFAVMGVFFGPLWFNKVQPENVTLLRLCFLGGGLALFLNYYFQFWQIYLQVQLNFKFVGIVKTIMTLAQLLPSLALAWYTRDPLLITLWGVATSAVQLVVCILYARHRYGAAFDFRKASMARAREMAAFTAKIFVSLLSSGFIATADRMILGNVASALDFSRYTIASNVGTRLQGLGVSVMPPVFHNTSFAVGRGKGDSAGAIYRELFDFTFDWYVLASVWAAVWHPVMLHLWLGAELGATVAPVFTPLMIAYCLGALASVSSSQLSALDRAGTALGFSLVVGAAAAAGVCVGWLNGGIVGAAWGFLASRVVYIVQDIYTGRLVGAAGWLNLKLWLGLVVQVAVGGAFALLFLIVPRESFWLLLPAGFHGLLVAAWLLRRPLRRQLGKFFSRPGVPTAADNEVIKS